MTMCFPLLLLICSVSMAQLQTQSDKEMIPQKQSELQRSEPTNGFDQRQTCTQDIHAVLREMSASLAEQKVEMRHLQRENEGSETLGPINAHTDLVFRHVVTNIGNAYNPNTGFFIAPVRGAYHFEFYIGAHGHSSHGSAAVLVKNGEHIFAVYEHQTSGFGTSANGATLLLEVGDVVYVRLWINSRVFDNENHHSTFSGHLLFTM
ncbi:complement C1q-like protein 2 [Centropristis striata]|uniref:complement C1q-like protein 2 n=1 Tax=Centropristis striata TaxID=184440 RepID=UPI0027DED704|nr:complement C1q-like protein 2 [Centropristis striata]